MGGDLLFGAVTWKGLGTGEAFVEHAGQRVDVGSGICGPSGETLWGHISQSPNDDTGFGDSGRSDIVGNAKVNQVGEVTAW
jgi:hypothetical protein